MICFQTDNSNSIRQEPNQNESYQVVLPDGRLARPNLPRRNAIPMEMDAINLNTQIIYRTRTPNEAFQANGRLSDSSYDEIIENHVETVLKDHQVNEICSDCSSGYSTEENRGTTIRFSGRLPVSNFGMTQYITKSFYIETSPSVIISDLKAKVAKGSESMNILQR